MKPGMEIIISILLKKQNIYMKRIKFRDLLKSNKRVAEQYVKMKEEIFEHVNGDRNKYTTLKSTLIQKILTKLRNIRIKIEKLYIVQSKYIPSDLCHMQDIKISGYIPLFTEFAKI